MPETRISDYAAFLRDLGASKADYFLGGGQAVNFWAEYFSNKGAGAAIERYRPFTSKDSHQGRDRLKAPTQLWIFSCCGRNSQSGNLLGQENPCKGPASILPHSWNSEDEHALITRRLLVGLGEP
jgi:hypothetical protein